MLTNNDIRIIYLSLLKREPSDNEKTNTSSYDSTSLEELLKSTSEYKVLNNIFEYNSEFNNDTNVKKCYNFIGDSSNTSGLILGNGNYCMETSFKYNKCNKSYIKDDFIEVNIVDVTTIYFMEINNVHTISNHTQSLDMNNCVFIDSFTLSNGIKVKIEKYPLHTHSTCFLQKITMSSVTDFDMNVLHSFNEKTYFNAFETEINSVMMNVSEIKNENIVVTNLYKFDQAEDVVNKGYDIVNNVIHNKFMIKLYSNIDSVFYVLSSALSDENELSNLEILTSTQLYSFEEIIAQHILKWNTKWSTRMDILNKVNITNLQSLKNNNFNYLIKSALFNIYCDIYNYDDFFTLPILNILKPNLAKDVLNKLIKGYETKAETTNALGKSGTFFYHTVKSGNNNNNKSLFVYKTALISIHIWNYFRVSKDKGWLMNIGFDILRSNADFLTECVKQNSITNVFGLDESKLHNNNALTNSLVALALTYTNHAIYELNYLSIKKYESIPSSIPLALFDENMLTQVTGNTITFVLGEANGFYHYDIFDSTNTNLGYQFGGDSGYKISLQSNTDYTLILDESLINYPITITHRIDSDYNKTKSLSNSLVMNSDELYGYKFNNFENTQGIFKDHFNANYGENAFINSSLENVIQPYDNYNFESLTFSEPLLLLNSYYSYNLQSKYPNSFTDIIKDNTAFYSKYSFDSDFNKVLSSGLTATIAQNYQSYEKKRTNINLFLNKMDQIKTLEPWGGDQMSKIVLFTMLTCIFGFKIKGEMNAGRLMTDDYGLKYEVKNVLPDPWKKIQLNNVGIDNKTFVINNNIYNDQPFSDIIGNLTYKYTMNEALNNVFFEVVPSTPLQTNMKVLINDVGDFTSNYTFDEINTNPNTSSSTSNIVIPYTTLSSTTDTTIPILIPELVNRFVNVIYEIGSNQYVVRQAFENIVDPTPNFINPTIYASTTLTTLTTLTNLKVNMNLNTLYKNTYQPFSNLNIDIFYDNNIIASNDITYTPNDADLSILNFSNNTDESKYNLNLTFNTSKASANYDIGYLEFGLKDNFESMLQSLEFPLIGTVTLSDSIFVNRTINFTNQSIQSFNLNFIDENPYPVFGTTADSSLKYYPIDNTIVIGSNSDSSTSKSTMINQYLLNNNKHIVNIKNNFYILRDNVTSTLEYYGLGNNTLNILMISALGYDTDIAVLTRCTYLEQYFLKSLLVDIKEIYSAKEFTIIQASNNKYYGIGKNEDYTLGNGSAENTDTIVECTLLNSLSSVKRISLNHTSVLIELTNGKFYGLGKNEIFQYLTDGVVNNPTLSNPTLLIKLNTIITENNFQVIRIESGNSHFKFYILNNSIYEWRGIGLNAFNSMGIGENIDDTFLVKYFPKLYLIEKFIHGSSSSYTGLTLSNKNEYYLLKTNGFDCNFTAILDKIRKEIYVIGTLDNGSIVYKTWTKLTSILVDDLKFYSISCNSLILGTSSSSNFQNL
jgi:hypothetical protein